MDDGEEVGAAFARGRAVYPSLALSRESFAQCVARVAGRDASPSLAELAVEDLYLACACAEGIAGAAAGFERRFAGMIRKAVARVLTGAADRDEAAQLTLRALLVRSQDGPPKIATYAGRGPLESWVAVTAVRTAVSVGRAGETERRLRERILGEAAATGDPELLLLKGELRRQVESAFEAALERLEDRERLILRLYLLSGMTMEDIGKVLEVGHQTVSRWLVKARKSVLVDVRREVGQRLKVSKRELESIVRLVSSQMDLSLSRLLAAE